MGPLIASNIDKRADEVYSKGGLSLRSGYWAWGGFCCAVREVSAWRFIGNRVAVGFGWGPRLDGRLGMLGVVERKGGRYREGM